MFEDYAFNPKLMRLRSHLLVSFIISKRHQHLGKKSKGKLIAFTI